MTEEAWDAADRDIIVREALVPELEGVTVERWVPQEAAASRGTERECMAFLRDDLATRFAERKQSLAPGK
ncbi:hypothetical protein BLJ79_03970 [Arthrobacter sp. UCD-GKA]|uniref:hypothetical protein n=1 Tax=Arthrobacter sp. UCD-GKA TaxID=1913576 RepID=UPI0008DE3910|nr:hypothetical protein [Arthrobacter sp. UCD-GKA]OIH85960.1 hypothetical protein BLJ79_03970 [Arthrobacter sp. UCD-GKA]